MSIQCPKCGFKLNNIPETVTVLTPDSPFLPKLFDGTLNKVVCPKCKMTLTLDGGHLVFRDAEKQYILYLMPEPEDGNTEALEEEIDATMTDEAQAHGIPRPTVRLTYQRPDFIEKISIHKLGFDDRLIEYAKLQLFRNMDELQLSRATHRLLLDYSRTNDEHLYFYVYDRESQKPINAIQVEMKDFLSLEEELMQSEDLQRELDAAFPGCHVCADRLI